MPVVLIKKITQCSSITLFLLLNACTSVEQLQPTLDVIESVQDILSENDASDVNNSQVKELDTEVVISEPPQDLWVYIRENLSLTHYKNEPRVIAEIQRFQRHPNTIKHFVKNAEPFLYYVVQQVEKNNLPLDLALLPAIESAYDPLAYSPGRAAGMWQFIESTGQMYDLHQTWWYDSRRDVVASTEAAVQYLKDLNTAFKGDWLHAIAAYNAGPGRIRSDIRKSIKKQNKHDYWSLGVPKETARYVPKLLAFVAIVESPEVYGFSLNKIANEPYFDVVDAEIQMNLHTVAEYLALQPEKIYKLNPGYNRHYTSPDGPHRLLVPTENIQKMRDMLIGATSESFSGEVVYSISAGETLSHVAQKYGVTIGKLCRWNNIRSNDVLSVGQKIIVKEGKYTGISPKVDRSAYTRKVTYQVRAGDSLYGIAEKFNVSVAQLKHWNNHKLVNKQYLYPGEKIKLYVDVTQVF